MNIKNVILAALLMFGGLVSIADAGESYVNLNDSNFTETISSGDVVVDFYTDWCGPCKYFAPIFEQVANEMHGQLTFAKVNVDVAKKTSSSQKIQMIPTIVLYRNGIEVKRQVGSMNADTFKKFIK